MKKMNQNIFVNQVRGYNIGNFIMLTPTIKALSTYYNTKIPVYFGCPYTQELFTNCDFIKIISHHKKHKEILSTRWINQKESDWSYIFKLIENKLNIDFGGVPHTYVDLHDKPNELAEIKEYCVIIRGCAGPVDANGLHLKDPGNQIYKHIIKNLNNKINIVFIGNEIDNQRFIKNMSTWCDNPIIILNSIKKSLGSIAHAKFIITNDTGFYHAAGALKKDSFVLWKNTNLIKNKTPNEDTFYSRKNNWEENFNEWIKTRLK